MSSHSVAIIGGGPAGLMAAEALSNSGVHVDVYDAMPSVGRKFLLAGRGGLNLTHSEDVADFIARYGARAPQIAGWLERFSADDLRAWAHGLGIETFVGTSGRVFPAEMKAAPLLRAWLRRLRVNGVEIHARHRWLGWDDAGRVVFDTPHGAVNIQADAMILALGGASWPRLGSDGAWQATLAQKGVAMEPLMPANCGFIANWSPYFAERFAGQPLKGIAMAPQGTEPMRRGECIITEQGLEGGLIYAYSAPLRDALRSRGVAKLHVDLLPDRTSTQIATEVTRPRGARSWSSHLGSRLGLRGAKMALLRECLGRDAFEDINALAATIKRLPIALHGIQPLEEAISTAGGVKFDNLDDGLMLRGTPGVFCAGEMLDWEAPTGGYLLTACFASGVTAANGVTCWLQQRPERR